MARTVESHPAAEVNQSSFNVSMIYLVLFICIITVVSYFMYKVYKKLQALNDEVVKVTNRGDSLDSSNKEHDRQIDFLAEHLKRVETSIVKPPPEPPNKVEIVPDNSEEVLERIVEE
tara:strand:- start:5126 stop:5476 length:351 start_codon:yes stop_codon:yes gene_type:complete